MWDNYNVRGRGVNYEKESLFKRKGWELLNRNTFVAMSIESIGNSTYNIILISIIIVNAIIMKILTKFGKSYQE